MFLDFSKCKSGAMSLTSDSATQRKVGVRVVWGGERMLVKFLVYIQKYEVLRNVVKPL